MAAHVAIALLLLAIASVVVIDIFIRGLARLTAEQRRRTQADNQRIGAEQVRAGDYPQHAAEK